MGGIIVDVNLSEHSATIQFSEYHDGAAPFLIINHTKDQILQFHQRWENRAERETIQGRVYLQKGRQRQGERTEFKILNIMGVKIVQQSSYFGASMNW